MPRLTSLEHQQATNIQSLAVPEVTTSDKNYFFQEVQKLKPELERVLEISKKADSFWHASSLWSFSFLFGSVVKTEQDMQKLKEGIESKVRRSDNELDFWHFALIQMIAPECFTREHRDLINVKVSAFWDGYAYKNSPGEYYSDYIEAISAAQILFPNSIGVSLRATDELRDHLKRIILDRYEQNQITSGLVRARDLRLIFTDEPDPLDRHWDKMIISRAKTYLESSVEIHRYQALYHLAIRKMTLADHLLIGREGIRFVFDDNQKDPVVAEEQLQPPMRRQF